MYASENSRIYHIFDSCHMSSGTKAAYQSKGPTHVYVVKFDFFTPPPPRPPPPASLSRFANLRREFALDDVVF